MVFGNIYMNERARSVNFAEGQPRYPEGAIIVREKLKTATSKTPQTVAAMIKREKGFNPAANDWEFLVVNGALTKIKRRQKTGECQSCHASQASNDFVFSVPATLRIQNPTTKN